MELDDRQGGGAGCAARSHLAFLGSWSKPLEGINDLMIVELLALPEGGIFARLLGYSHVMMEMDNLEIVNLWPSRDNSPSIAMSILREIGEIALSFSFFFSNSACQRNS